MKAQIQRQIAVEGNIWLDAWIPLDWARAYLMLGDINKSVEASEDFYKKATAIRSPHAKSRVFRLLNTMEAAGYAEEEAVKNFRRELYESSPGQANTNDLYIL
ncbi:hypothetical protein [Dictyobacter arantiisoli]|uniref:Bacterial transcriptional activator domain-containing protein n=1 Tax=Dictyobacter arantiisoli TaxID=2014874 RepID=A0A5A5T9W9_9CHLR|nr:hypothetical protein [Dictyobacter arantiisoli]GCF07813.1 hypothetical protein KDI_13770 [Dictyobacter arantiisoli]